MFMVLVILYLSLCDGYHNYHHRHGDHHATITANNGEVGGKLKEIFAWKQISYLIDGVTYANDTDYSKKDDHDENIKESDKYFIQYNNVPIGFEKHDNRIFITVPRRRHGIPSTLNYVNLHSSTSPDLRPYPGSEDLVSVYRPRVDRCSRLWMVDTGLLEVLGDRKQIKPPSIVIYDLKTNKRILTHELKSEELINERTSAGLTSIAVEVDPTHCEIAHAYINDLATNSLITFSLKDRTTWRIEHPSFIHDEQALNFTVAGHTINWKDGIFSITLTEPDKEGKRQAYFHPLVSLEEFSLDTDALKSRSFTTDKIKRIGTRGPNTQSGSHDYHRESQVIFFANVAQDAILCWNTKREMKPENIAIVAQDHKKLVYISDLKVIGDDVWVLVNQIPRFVYSMLNKEENNYFIHRGKVQDLISGTICQ